MSKTVNNADQINAVITTNGDATASVDFTPTQDTHVVNKAYVDSVVPNVANHSLITNGGFDVWQRGTVFNPVPVDGYTADRWVCLYAGTSPSVSKNTSAGGNALLITGVAGNTGTTVDHRIEQANVKHLNNGGNVTLSFGSVSSDVATVDVSLIAPTALDNWTSPATTIATTTLNLVAGGNNLNHTFTLPANAVQFGLGVRFAFGTLTTGQRTLVNVKLEQGSVATPWFYEDYGTTLAKCQRYYQKFGNTAGIVFSPVSTSQMGLELQYNTPMRITPTVNFTPTNLTNPVVAARTQSVRFISTDALGASTRSISDVTLDAEL